MPTDKQPGKKQAPKKQAPTKPAAKKQPAKKQPGVDIGKLQQGVLDAAAAVVTDWVQSEKMTGNDKLDAGLQKLTQAYRAWEGNR